MVASPRVGRSREGFAPINFDVFKLEQVGLQNRMRRDGGGEQVLWGKPSDLWAKS